MFRLGADLPVYLHRDPIDFRTGMNSLAVLVQEAMALDPFQPAVLPFATVAGTGSSCSSSIGRALCWFSSVWLKTNSAGRVGPI